MTAQVTPPLEELLELEELLLDEDDEVLELLLEDELDELELEEVLDDELLLELELDELLDELELLELEELLDELELLPPEQVGRTKLPLCVPWKPKLVLWPADRLPFQETLPAVAVLPEVETLALHEFVMPGL